MEQDQSSSLFEMQADGLIQRRLTSISNWTRFISIAGIIMMILAGIFLAAFGVRFFDKFTELIGFNRNAIGALIAVCLLFGALFFAWFFCLLRASSLIKQGLASHDSARLAEGFKMLKIYFVISVVTTLLSFFTTIAAKFTY